MIGKEEQARVQYALQLMSRLSICQNEILFFDMPEYTQWMLVRDHTNNTLYYYSNMNHNIQAIKMNELDFSKGSKRTETSIHQGEWRIDSTSKLK